MQISTSVVDAVKIEASNIALTPKVCSQAIGRALTLVLNELFFTFECKTVHSRPKSYIMIDCWLWTLQEWTDNETRERNRSRERRETEKERRHHTRGESGKTPYLLPKNQKIIFY